MFLTQRDYDLAELEQCRRTLAGVEDPARQVTPSPAGREYRRDLEARIAELEARLASEEG